MIGAIWPLEETIGASRNRANDSFEVLSRHGWVGLQIDHLQNLWMVKADLGLHPIANAIETIFFTLQS